MDAKDVARIVAYELRQIRAHYKGQRPNDKIATGVEIAYEAISDKLVEAGMDAFPPLKPLS